MSKVFLLMGFVVWLVGVGCAKDRPPEYGRERPPVGELDARDKGLQSKDLLEATDRMTMDLLALPALNQSQAQWTIVVDRMENQTTDPRFNYDIFIGTLKTSIAKHGQGRLAIIENRARLRDIQGRELELEGGASGPAGVQPDYALYGKVQELRGAGTSTYRMEFNLVGLKGKDARVQVWTNDYIVKAARK